MVSLEQFQRTGTMHEGQDQATREAYSKGIDSLSNFKSRFFAQRMQPEIADKGKVIVDVGSMTGALVKNFAEAFPNTTVVGVEVDESFHEQREHNTICLQMLYLKTETLGMC